ncbi:MAG: pilus assembly protein PilM [Candidatus Omnitrophica bacterium]|nr:pilus assembly protein PilM [Candidatus Omnitrophota bacterium]
MPKNIYSIVEITDSHVKLVQARVGSNQSVITWCDARPLQDTSDEELQKYLSELLVSRNIQEDCLQVIIPRRLCIAKQLDLPSQDPREIQQMVDIQLVSQIPYALEEVVYKYQVLEQTSAGQSKVMIVIVHRELIDKYLQMFKKSGIRVADLTYSSLGLSRWWNYQRQKDSLLEDTPVLLLNIDYSGSEIAFCFKGQVWFSRNIDAGFKQLANENWFEFENQIQLSMAAYNKAKMGPEIKQIKVISASSESEKLCAYLKEKFRLPVTVLASTAHLQFEKKADLMAVEQDGISVAVSAGLSRGEMSSVFNLVPKEIGQQKYLKARRVEIIKLLLLALVLCGIGLAFDGVDIILKSQTLARIQKRAELVKPRLKELQKKKVFLDALKLQQATRIDMPGFLVVMQGLVGKDISLRSLSVDSQRNLVIMGYAESDTAVNMFQSRMVQSKLLSDVNLQFATKRRIYNMELTDFKITAKIKNK